MGTESDSSSQDGGRVDFEAGDWENGPPLEIFERMRSQCPIHFTPRIVGYPEEAGYWSVTKAADIAEVSHDWETYSSAQGFTANTSLFPVALQSSMMIGMDPPRHDRIKNLFQRGFTPKRIAGLEEDVRSIVLDVINELGGRDSCDLVVDVAQPVVSRVICSLMGIPKDEIETWAVLVNRIAGATDPDLNQGGVQSTTESDLPQLLARCQALIAERRANPTDDLTSVLIGAEVDGEQLAEQEIIMGLFTLIVGGNDTTKSTYCSAMKALLESPQQWQMLLDDPSLIPGAINESLRMFPALSHMRRTATRDTELGGVEIKEGDKVVMWYVSSSRDESVYEEPNRFDITRGADHQAFGAGGRHFCLGFSLAHLELRLLLEETLKRYPEMQLDGVATHVDSGVLNQLKSLPVRLVPAPATVAR